MPSFPLFFSLVVLWTVNGDEIYVKVQTEKNVMAKCGEAVTLHCNITSMVKSLFVKNISWNVQDGSLCSNHGTESLSNFTCQYIEKQSLAVTIPHPDESHNGTYTCSVISSVGHGQGTTYLEVSECERKREPRGNINVGESRSQASISRSHWTYVVLSLTALLLRL